MRWRNIAEMFGGTGRSTQGREAGRNIGEVSGVRAEVSWGDV